MEFRNLWDKLGGNLFTVLSASGVKDGLTRQEALLWNRMSSGSYFPSAVKLVEIPKSNGGKRPLGIPTVEDRVAQMAVVLTINPLIEPYFHADSYGYRPERSAHDALGVARLHPSDTHSGSTAGERDRSGSCKLVSSLRI